MIVYWVDLWYYCPKWARVLLTNSKGLVTMTPAKGTHKFFETTISGDPETCYRATSKLVPIL